MPFLGLEEMQVPHLVARDAQYSEESLDWYSFGARPLGNHKGKNGHYTNPNRGFVCKNECARTCGAWILNKPNVLIQQAEERFPPWYYTCKGVSTKCKGCRHSVSILVGHTSGGILYENMEILVLCEQGSSGRSLQLVGPCPIWEMYAEGQTA